MKLIITGATGMVGEGVLHEALLDKNVEQISVVNRRPVGYTDPRVKEIILPDFFNITHELEGIRDHDSCLFCLGVSSVGMDKDTYYQLTYTLTMNFARALINNNPRMSFQYVSGAGTDRTEKGKIGWARVKGKTENDLMSLGFKAVYGLRPGYLHPTPGMKHTHRYYSFISWLFRPLRLIWPNSANTLSELGLAMLQIARNGYDKDVISISDINLLAKKHKHNS